MADFKVKNGLQAKRYLQTTTALASTATAIDLSKGNNFSITPSGNPTFTFTNPPATGKAQAFSVEVTGGSNGMDEIFSTTTYTGTGSSFNIENGIDLSGSNEGLVWTKRRDHAGNGHMLVDTIRGGSSFIKSNTTDAANTSYTLINSFNSNGYTLSTNGWVNGSGDSVVSWTWKSSANFFDVVTYSGNGSHGRTVSHNLGSVPGMILIKRTNSSDDWRVFHRSQSNKYAALNSTFQFQTDGGNIFGDPGDGTATAPTSTNFTVANDASVNGSGSTYVAYLFAHNSSKISCGSYTGNGSATGPTVDVGFQPQWILIKNATTSGQGWYVWDTVRGIVTDGSEPILQPHLNDAESTVSWLDLTSTGFAITDNGYQTNKSGDTYIYVAIAAGGAGSLTWPTSVKYPSGTAPSSPALGKKDVFTFMTVDGGTSYVGKKAVEGLS